jgi:SAM-dependent methyltransferase
MKDILDKQREYWDEVFAENADFFGGEPSYPARQALVYFRREKGPAGRKRILDLGCGQGRDALYFAGERYQVYVLDYSERGLNDLRKKAGLLGVSGNLVLFCHDVRKPLPFPDETFDACFSHMLYCMALTTADLLSLNAEMHRVLKDGGLNIYTARNVEDPHYGKGVFRGEDLYEMDGFIVHFFTREKISMLSQGFDLLQVESFAEGSLPRKLFFIVMRKKDSPVKTQ